MVRARYPVVSAHHDRVVPHAALPVASRLVAFLVLELLRDGCSWLQAPGAEALHVLASPPASLRFSLSLGPEGILARLSRAFPPPGIPSRYYEDMQVVGPRNLGIVPGSKTSTLDERTKSWISPSCHSMVIV